MKERRQQFEMEPQRKIHQCQATDSANGLALYYHLPASRARRQEDLEDHEDLEGDFMISFRFRINVLIEYRHVTYHVKS
jgi:hypothetical protein